jgi:hypothetical protein
MLQDYVASADRTEAYRAMFTSQSVFLSGMALSIPIIRILQDSAITPETQYVVHPFPIHKKPIGIDYAL